MHNLSTVFWFLNFMFRQIVLSLLSHTTCNWQATVLPYACQQMYWYIVADCTFTLDSKFRLTAGHMFSTNLRGCYFKCKRKVIWCSKTDITQCVKSSFSLFSDLQWIWTKSLWRRLLQFSPDVYQVSHEVTSLPLIIQIMQKSIAG